MSSHPPLQLQSTSRYSGHTLLPRLHQLSTPFEPSVHVPQPALTRVRAARAPLTQVSTTLARTQQTLPFLPTSGLTQQLPVDLNQISTRHASIGGPTAGEAPPTPARWRRPAQGWCHTKVLQPQLLSSRSPRAQDHLQSGQLVAPLWLGSSPRSKRFAEQIGGLKTTSSTKRLDSDTTPHILDDALPAKHTVPLASATSKSPWPLLPSSESGPNPTEPLPPAELHQNLRSVRMRPLLGAECLNHQQIHPNSKPRLPATPNSSPLIAPAGAGAKLRLSPPPNEWFPLLHLVLCDPSP